MTAVPLSAPASAPASRKLGGYDFYREVLGSPKFVVAPMVDQSELAWRVLSRRYGAELVYTPMIGARHFAQDVPAHRDKSFDLTHGEEGAPSLDRPLVVQFCANDPDQLLAAARLVQGSCDAVDLNLGCPQDIAKKGRYGAFLQDEWDLIYRMVNILHENLDVPVTAKFRIFSDVNKTVEYAKMLERAGAQILTCHGRLREQRGHNTGMADWAQIRAVKAAVRVPVFANGNVLYHSDLTRCLATTGADAVMSAEGQLYNAALFARADHAHRPPGALPTSFSLPPTDPSSSDPPPAFDAGLHPPCADLALEYLSIVGSLKTHTAWSGVKGHLFKLLRPALAAHTDLRDQLGRIKKDALEDAVALVQEFKTRLDAEAAANAHLSPAELTVFLPPPPAPASTDAPTDAPAPAADADDPHAQSRKTLPRWLAQPYWRPPPPVAVVAAEHAKAADKAARVARHEARAAGKADKADKADKAEALTAAAKSTEEVAQRMVDAAHAPGPTASEAAAGASAQPARAPPAQVAEDVIAAARGDVAGGAAEAVACADVAVDAGDLAAAIADAVDGLTSTDTVPQADNSLAGGIAAAGVGDHAVAPANKRSRAVRTPDAEVEESIKRTKVAVLA